MNNMREKAKQQIDDKAEAAKATAGKVVDKSKDAAKWAGKKMEKGAKRLQDA